MSFNGSLTERHRKSKKVSTLFQYNTDISTYYILSLDFLGEKFLLNHIWFPQSTMVQRELLDGGLAKETKFSDH